MSAVPKIPPLHAGDRLTRAEFERRYEAMPFLNKAELLEGIVHIMSSPVTEGYHAGPHFDLIGWMSIYRFPTPGVVGGDNGSLRLDMDNEPQPDAFLRLLAEFGGQSRISPDNFVEGAPEVVGEVAYSSVSYDLNIKLKVYRRNGVREYIVWRTYDQAIDWFILRDGEFARLPLGSDGIYRSEVFPGLWLDPKAMVKKDLMRVRQVANDGLASPEYAAFVEKLGQMEKNR